MSNSSRRGFLKIAGVGAAVGVTFAATAAVRSDGANAAAGATPPCAASGPLVAYVRDVRSAEIAVMVGDSEVVVHDRELVARLAGARAVRAI